jgi:hypothetical protein
MIATAHRVGGRVAERDALLIMMAYRHGLALRRLVPVLPPTLANPLTNPAGPVSHVGVRHWQP